MSQEESIYNIIPKEYNPEPKPPLYKSKYPPTIPPTGSTFCHKTTSKPGVINHRLRSPTFQVSSLKGSRLTLNTVERLPWDISNMIENHHPIISEENIREPWETALFLP